MKLTFDIIGWAGAACVLTAYFLISTDKISADSNKYQLMNLAGSVCLIMHTYYQFAYPSVFVNVIWAAIAVYSMVKNRKK
jgi:hypothetical protein